MTDKERRLDRRMEDEARDLHNIMMQHRTNQLIKSLAIAAFCLFTILGVLAYGIVNTNNRARESSGVTERGVNCLIEQFAEHRENTADAHRHIAEGVGEPLTPPNGVLTPDELEGNLRLACGEFTK